MAALRIFIAIGILAALLGETSQSIAAEPVVSHLQPHGGQRGTEVTIAIHGQRLGDGPHQVLLYDKGIEVTGIEVVDGKQVKCTLRLDDDCRVGRHALRLRTASGLSNLVTFHVGALRDIDEAEPNNSLEQPQEIATDVVVNGVVKTGDTDVFAVDLVKGERLSVEIEGLRLGRTLFDPMIELRDAAGTLLATNDDQPAAQQDAFVSIRAASSGRVLILVRESAFRGSDAATYRLHVGRFPRPAAVFPSAVVRGEPAELTWINDNGEQQTTTVEIPATSDATFDAQAIDEHGISPSGIPLFLTDAKPVLETEPNNRREEANELAIPGVATGVISEENDKDFYRIVMKKGETWDFFVRARELRSPLDAVLRVYDGNGRYVKGNDDNAGQPDSYIRYQAPADGEYWLNVEDRMLRGRQEMTYVVEAARPTSIAELQLDERQRYRAQVINIPQGGRTAAMMTVKRKDLGGPLQLKWEGLPEGSEAQSEPLAANFHRVPVLFSAKPRAELGASLATVSAHLTEGSQTIASPFRQRTWLVRGRNNVHVWSHFAERAPVAVTQALPYSIRAVEPKAPLVQGGSIEIKIVAKRDKGFENSIGVRTIYNPPGVSTNQSRSVPKNKLEALIPITANAKARTGEWKLAFLGRTSIGGAVECSTQLTTLRIVEPYFDAKISTFTVTQGGAVEWTVPLDQRTPFEGDAELELVRLPPGVTAEKVKVQATSESAVFQLKIADDARVGRHRGVGCRIRLTVEGESVRYGQGYAELRVDPAPAAKTAAKPTSGEDQAS